MIGRKCLTSITFCVCMCVYICVCVCVYASSQLSAACSILEYICKIREVLLKCSHSLQVKNKG